MSLPDGNTRPRALMEFFPSPPSDLFGEDPCKHAISVCYAVDAPGDLTVRIREPPLESGDSGLTRDGSVPNNYCDGRG